MSEKLPPPTPARTTVPSWTQKLCPILSLASLKTEASKIQALNGRAPGPVPQATPCQGGKCMFFIPQIDAATQRPDGDGVCCVTLFPIAINQLGALHGQIATQALELNDEPPKTYPPGPDAEFKPIPVSEADAKESVL